MLDLDGLLPTISPNCKAVKYSTAEERRGEEGREENLLRIDAAIVPIMMESAGYKYMRSIVFSSRR